MLFLMTFPFIILAVAAFVASKEKKKYGVIGYQHLIERDYFNNNDPK